MRYVQLRQEREQGLQSAEHSFQPQFFNAKRAGAVSEYSQKYLRNFHYRGPMPTKIADKTTTARRRPDGYSFQTATYGQNGFKSATSVSIVKVSNYLLVFMLLIYRVGMRRIRASITDRTLQDRYCFNFNGLVFQMRFTVYTTFHYFDISLDSNIDRGVNHLPPAQAEISRVPGRSVYCQCLGATDLLIYR